MKPLLKPLMKAGLLVKKARKALGVSERNSTRLEMHARSAKVLAMAWEALMGADMSPRKGLYEKSALEFAFSNAPGCKAAKAFLLLGIDPVEPIRMSNFSGKTSPFLIALRAGRWDIAELILSGVDRLPPGDDFSSAPNALRLQELGRDLASERVAASLFSMGADFNQTDFETRTLLHWLAHHPVETAQTALPVLLKCGCDINLRTRSGLTPLMLAGSQASPKLATLLIENGADPHAIDAQGADFIEHLARGLINLNANEKVIEEAVELMNILNASKAESLLHQLIHDPIVDSQKAEALAAAWERRQLAACARPTVLAGRPRCL